MKAKVAAKARETAARVELPLLLALFAETSVLLVEAVEAEGRTRE